MAGVRFKFLQAATPLLDEQFDRILFVVNLAQTNIQRSNSRHRIVNFTMELFLTIPNRINFLQMGRFGRSSEQRFRMNFRKKYDWISFDRTMAQEGKPHRRAVAIDPIYISKSGKKTPGVGYFWSGCASAVKWGPRTYGLRSC